jgi:hypothetical protein
MPNFNKIRSTFGVTPYNPERKDPKAIYEHYQDQISTQPMPEEKLPWNVPFPPGQFAQEEFDDMLMRQVVDPLSKAGFQDLGAGLASIPSAAHSMLVPQTELDLAATIIPLPGIAKAMKKGKYRKIRNAMKAEDPENVGKIISEQALKADPTEYQKMKEAGEILKTHIFGDKPKAKVSAIDEKEMFRKADEANAREASRLKWEAKRLEEEPIREGIKKKYGLESENWSTKDSEADLEFGHSDLSGKQGDLYEITDGETTLQVTEDEYLDIMGLSRAIPIDETPFAQSMKTKKPKVETPKSIDELNSEKDMFKADQKARMKRDTEAIKIKEPHASPKGDPEAFLRPQEPQQFSRIRQVIDPTTARFDERGNIAGNVGQSDFMPYEQPAMPRFEDVQKRNYVESELGPEKQLISKILSDPQNLNLTPEQKQALANFVRTRSKGLDKVLLKEDLVNRLGLREADSRSALQNYVGSRGARNDLQKLEIEHGLDDSRQTWKAYEDLDKNFGANQSIISKRDPSVKRMFEMLYDDMPYGRLDTPLESAQELQRKMYSGRPTYDEEMAKIARESEPQKFGKTKEALKGSAPKGRLRVIKVADGKDVTDAFGAKENLADFTVEELQKIVDSTGKRYRVEQAGEHVPSGSKYTQGKYKVVDWAGNEKDFFGTYDDTGEAYEEIAEWLRSKGIDEEELDLELGEYNVVPRKK